MLTVLLNDGSWAGILVAGIIGGIIAGFFLSRWFFKKEMMKNPPINEAMIRTLYQSVGRKPSEADIQRTMAAVRRSANNK